jgi:hypothetical protein
MQVFYKEFYQDYFSDSYIVSAMTINRITVPPVLRSQFGYCFNKRIAGGFVSFSKGTFTKALTGLPVHKKLRVSIRRMKIGTKQ